VTNGRRTLEVAAGIVERPVVNVKDSGFLADLGKPLSLFGSLS
jgi:hypothetical protein